MNFNEKQSKKVYDFIMKYHTDAEFKSNAEQSYDCNTYKLSILQIYALEEILRYGAKEIFQKFLKTKGTYSIEQAIDLYDGFVQLLKEDSNFKQYKMQQLKESPETLSEMEMFAFSLISHSDEQKAQMHEDMTEELEYDPYNPLLYSTDREIRETLENLFFGELIHRMLELPTMKSVKARQKEDGKIANIDKPFIIEKIRSIISEHNSITQLKQAIDSRYVNVKMNILLGKGESAFEPYVKFNTNISSSEILGIEKDHSASDLYNYFMDIISKRKKQDEGKKM